MAGTAHPSERVSDACMDAKEAEWISVEKAREEIAGGSAAALDVRDDDEWGQAHVSGATHLPQERLSSELEGLDHDQRLIVFAEDDRTAAEAVATLREAGIDAAAAEGGMDSWVKQGFNIQPTEDPDEDTELGAG